MSKRILCGLLIVSLLFVCGCWDIREGESQAFVLGIGMDAACSGVRRSRVVKPSNSTVPTGVYRWFFIS